MEIVAIAARVSETVIIVHPSISISSWTTNTLTPFYLALLIYKCPSVLNPFIHINKVPYLALFELYCRFVIVIFGLPINFIICKFFIIYVSCI